MTRLLLALIAFYQRRISSPLHAMKPSRCKFVPTCSEYAAVAIATYGALRGTGLAAWRLLRCHPFGPGGYDPVPSTSGPVPSASGSVSPIVGRCAPSAHSAGGCASEPLP